MDGQLRDMANALKSEGIVREKNYNDNSLNKLLRETTKKTRTGFIGALASFEKYFGEIWGQGLTVDECDNEQLYWREVKEKCRNEILNNGNSQIRAIENELKQYTVKWNRYKLNFRKDDNV